MEITLKIPDNFVFDLLHNLPEYAVSFECREFNYEKCEFTLIDVEEGKKYLLTREMAEKGFRKLITMLSENELPGLSISNSNWFDQGNWDCHDVDALLQCAIFDDVIYG